MQYMYMYMHMSTAYRGYMYIHVQNALFQGGKPIFQEPEGGVGTAKKQLAKARGGGGGGETTFRMAPQTP